MFYKLAESKIIHWDEMFDLIDEKEDIDLESSIAIDICMITNGGLPIILEGHIKAMQKNNLILNCIIHTKAFIRFEYHEKPVEDLIKMLEESFVQENAIFEAVMRGTPFHWAKIKEDVHHPHVRFNKARQLVEHARKVQLLA